MKTIEHTSVTIGGRTVPARKTEITQKEYFQAAAVGLKPQACFTVRAGYYHGEDRLVLLGDLFDRGPAPLVVGFHGGGDTSFTSVFIHFRTVMPPSVRANAMLVILPLPTTSTFLSSQYSVAHTLRLLLP